MLVTLVTLLGVAASIHCTCPLSTPVVLWSTQSVDAPDEAAREETSIRKLLRGSQLVFVFYHPELSIEQFSKQANAYSVYTAGRGDQFDRLVHFAHGYSTFSSATVDSGEKLLTLAEGEAERSNASVVRASMSGLRGMQFGTAASYVMVALPAFDDESVFSARDFGKSVSELGRQLIADAINHTMIYTGLGSSSDFCTSELVDLRPNGDEESESEVTDSDGDDTLLRRKRRNTDDNGSDSVTRPYTYINVDNCLLFFSSLIEFSLSTEGPNGARHSLDFLLPPLYSPGNGTKPRYDPTQTWCSANLSSPLNTAALTFGFKNVAANGSSSSDTQLNYLVTYWVFERSGIPEYGFWSLKYVNVSFVLHSSSPSTSGFPSELFNTKISRLPFDPVDDSWRTALDAPYFASYHCTTVSLSPNADGASSIKKLVGNQPVWLSLHLSDLQLQPFVQPQAMVNGIPQFGDANDCSGFFTIPILMAFFVLFILLLVLFITLLLFSTVGSHDRWGNKHWVISIGLEEDY